MTHLLLANISAPIAHERNWCDSFINELIKWSSDDAIHMWGITYGEWWTYFCVFVLQFIIYYLAVGAIAIYTNIPIKWKKFLYWYKLIATILIMVLYLLLVTFINAVDSFKATV